MKNLLEDYKRRLIYINDIIKNNEEPLNNGSESSLKKKERLNTKAGCYRTIISELEREIENEDNSYIIVINDNYNSKVFSSLEKYKIWCETQVKNGVNPDNIVSNYVHEVKEGEHPSDKNMIDIHDFHCELYPKI